MNQERAIYKNMPHVAYRVLEHLMTDERAEIIWKLLKYDDADAYKKPNLTMEEKAALIYKGQSDATKYNVFLDFYMDDAEQGMNTILRIYPGEIHPTNRVTGIVVVNMEVFAHAHINHLSNYTTRIDTIVQTLIEVLHGVDVSGVGVLYFDNQVRSFNNVKAIGQKPFKGKLLKMSVIMD